MTVALLAEGRDDARDLLAHLDVLEAALRGPATPVRAIREPRADADATGVWLAGSARLVHRVAGMSKATPPIDPFRTGTGRGRADDVQRGKGETTVRRELLHVATDGRETSVVVDAAPSFALRPDHLDPVWSMRLQIGLVRDAVAASVPVASFDHAQRTASWLAAAALGRMTSAPIRGATIGVHMPSPLGPGRHWHSGISADDVDGVVPIRIHPDWPQSMRLLRRIEGTSTHWTLCQHAARTRLVDLDPVACLRLLSEPCPHADDVDVGGLDAW